MIFFSKALKKKITQRIVKIKLAYIPVALTCVSFFLIVNRRELYELLTKSNPSFFLMALVSWVFFSLINPLFSYFILKSLDYSFSYNQLLKIYVKHLPARYIPGGVWHTVTRLADYHSCGVLKKHLTLLAAFESFFPIPFSFFLGGALLWRSTTTSLPESVEIIATITGGIILLCPFFFHHNKFVQKHFSRFVFYYCCILCLALFSWLLSASSFSFYYQAIVDQNLTVQYWLTVVGAYIFSWGTGCIAFFAPQGVGVFEVVAGMIIDIPMTFGSAVAFLAGFRIIIFFSDFFLYFLLRIISIKHSPFLTGDNKNLRVPEK